MNKDHSFDQNEMDPLEETISFNAKDFHEFLHTVATYCISQAYGILISGDHSDKDRKRKSKIGTPLEMLVAHVIAAQEVRDQDLPPLEVKLRHSLAQKWVSQYFLEVADDDLPPEEVLRALVALKMASKKEEEEESEEEEERKYH